jgi:flavin reductase (DIM6/NTAB) family NADH-FMN oxidoreductase RutF
MRLDITALKAREAYAWLTATIMPRPIAWVSTVSSEGRANLAPFSFFQGVTSTPPSLLFVPVNTRDGTPKDTVRNLLQIPEFVVNLVPRSLAEPMNATAALLPYGESEFAAFGIASTASEKVRPPRVAQSPVSFECTVHQIVNVGQGPGAAHVVIGLIQVMHVDDAVLGADGMPDSAKLDLIGRMGGEVFTRTTDTFVLPRPDRKRT